RSPLAAGNRGAAPRTTAGAQVPAQPPLNSGGLEQPSPPPSSDAPSPPPSTVPAGCSKGHKQDQPANCSRDRADAQTPEARAVCLTSPRSCDGRHGTLCAASPKSTQPEGGGFPRRQVEGGRPGKHNRAPPAFHASTAGAPGSGTDALCRATQEKP